MITDEAMKQPILSAKKVTMSDTSISFEPVSGAVSPRFAGVSTILKRSILGWLGCRGMLARQIARVPDMGQDNCAIFQR